MKNNRFGDQSEEYDWVTLVTCEFYNPFSGDFSQPENTFFKDIPMKIENLLSTLFSALIITALLLSATPAQPAYAAGITVTNGTSTIANGDGCSLPEAIINANTDSNAVLTDCAAGSGADVITLNIAVALTTAYASSTTIGGGQAGLPDITSNITIQAGTGTTISGNDTTFRIFYITGTLTLDGVTVQNGRIRPANNSDLLASIAYVQRRQNNWDEGVTNLEKALTLDPRSGSKAQGLALTYLYMHRLKDVGRLVDNLLRSAPDDQSVLFWSAMGSIYMGEDETAVRTALSRLDLYADRSFFAYWAELADIFLRDFDSALQRRSGPGNYELADTVEFLLRRAEIHRYMGNEVQSGRFSNLSREVSEARVSSQPDIAKHHMDLAIAYAGLNRGRDALDEAEQAIELLPVSEDALSGPDLLRPFAEVHVLIGQHGEAIAMLEHLLNIPSRTQVGELRRHPRWDPLRDDPRFQALLETYDKASP